MKRQVRALKDIKQVREEIGIEAVRTKKSNAIKIVFEVIETGETFEVAR